MDIFGTISWSQARCAMGDATLVSLFFSEDPAEIAQAKGFKLGDLKRPGPAVRPEHLQRAEMPERPERPERPEKPERPAKPERPEKPERSGKGR